MQDLTQGPIGRHLAGMAAFIGLGMLFQTLYLLIDLYFVSRLGETAIAGVAAASNVSFLVMALNQIIAVGSIALISQAIGRKDWQEAGSIFNQSMILAAAAVLVTLVFGYALSGWAMRQVAAAAPAAEAGTTYLHWFLPSLVLMYPITAMQSALRGAGIVKPGMMIQTFTVILNALLAPVLISGAGTGVALGVAGAGLASSISVAAGFAMSIFVFNKVQKNIRLHWKELAPRLYECRRIVSVGLPSAGEFILMFMVNSVVYWATRPFGAHAQAGFGIGARVMMSIYLPAMAVSFATAPIVGQNYGAKAYHRVRETFRFSAITGCSLLLAASVLCRWNPDILIRPFSHDEAVIAVARTYLETISWVFVFSGLTFTCSGVFQGLGDTRPSLLSSGSRILTFVLPIAWLAGRPDTVLTDFWHVSVVSIVLQSMLSFSLLRREFSLKLRSAG